MKENIENIRRFYDSNLIKVLTGKRGVGKSVLLDQIKEELLSEKGIENNHIIFIQEAYMLSSDDVIEREFGAFNSVRDSSTKFVFSLDEYDMSKDEITHFNIEDWLLNKMNVTLS